MSADKSNNFDCNLLIDDAIGTAAAPGPHIGFWRTGLNIASLGPRILPLSDSPNGTLVAPAGSIVQQTNGTVWVNTDSGTTWTQLGNLSGAVTLTAIDSTATADFDWDIADNSATAISFDAVGAPGILGIDSTNGAENVFTNNAFKLNDGATLQFGTPGTDIVITADGTDAVVTGTGDVVVADDVGVGWGTDKDFLQHLDSAGNELRLQGLDVTDVAATPATAAFLLDTGARVTTDAAAGPGSGAVTVNTGATDVTNAGGTGGNSGDVVVTTGAATSTAGASGDSGAISLTTGNSDDANSGNVTLQTGTAGGTRGSIFLNAPITSFATQATDIEIIDNTANALQISQASNVYIDIDTTDGAEVVTLGNTTTNPNLAINSAGYVETNGIDLGTRVALTERFLNKAELNADIANFTANKQWELDGTNAASANSTLATGGGNAIATAGALNDQAVITPHTDAQQSQFAVIDWNSDQQIIAKFNIRLIDNTDIRVECGVRTTTTALDDGTDADKFLVRFDTSDGVTSAVNFVAVASDTGVDDLEDTGIAAAANTNYRVVFMQSAAQEVSLYINGVLVNTPANQTTAASVSLGDPYFGIQALVAAAKNSQIHALAISQLAA